MRYFCLLLCWPLSVFGELAELVAVADTVILEDSTPAGSLNNFNLGRQLTLPVGARGGNSLGTGRMLMRFDVAGSVPAGSVITRARLRLRVTRVPEDPPDSDFALHRILRPWVEGEGVMRDVQGEIVPEPTGTAGGSLAMEGEVTWNSQAHDQILWSIPGGTFGSDYIAEPSAVQAIGTTTGTRFFEFGGDGIAEVQAMLDDPGSNFGWMLLSQDEETRRAARRIGSRDIPSPPRLLLEFDLPASFVITSVGLSEDNTLVTIRFPGSPDFSYELQASTDLSPGGWATVQNLASPVEAGELSFIEPVGDETRRFFRVVATAVEEG